MAEEARSWRRRQSGPPEPSRPVAHVGRDVDEMGRDMWLDPRTDKLWTRSPNYGWFCEDSVDPRCAALADDDARAMGADGTWETPGSWTKEDFVHDAYDAIRESLDSPEGDGLADDAGMDSLSPGDGLSPRR